MQVGEGRRMAVRPCGVGSFHVAQFVAKAIAGPGVG
jgi:hypothetical protein